MGSMMVHEPCKALTSSRSRLSNPKLTQPLARVFVLSWLVACSSSSQNDNAAANDTGGRGNGSGIRSERPSTGAEGPIAAGDNPAGDSLGSVDDAPSSEVPPATNATIDADGEAPSGPSASGGNTDSDPAASDAELDDGTSCPGATNGALSAAAPGELTETVTAGGLTRSFIRRVPPGYTGATALPVVIDFHPRGSSAVSWKESTRWASLADARGFAVVWPNGVENSWNVGERCCGPAHDQNVDDVAFTRAILAALERALCIDRRRIYATGCSNGGGMAYKLACSAADVIAAVAPVDFDCTTGPTNNPSCAACSPARPISATQFRGTNDQVVPYEGGVSAVNSAITFPGAPANFAAWGQINSCTGAPSTLPDLPTCSTFPMCGAGVETTLCTVQNGTHCGSYDSFDIVNIAWEQMSKATLP